MNKLQLRLFFAIFIVGRSLGSALQAGTLFGVGDNTIWELGDPSRGVHLTPILIDTNVASISAGYRHTLYTKSDGSLWGVGANYIGQLGDGTTTNKQTVSMITPFIKAFAAGGEYYSAFVRPDGTLWACPNYPGSGIPSPGSQIQIASNVTKVSPGELHVLFITSDGALWGIGYNDWGELGDGTTTTRTSPVKIADNVIDASAAHSQSIGTEVHSLFVKSDKTLWAIGNNRYGQFGNGTTISSTRPVMVANNVIMAVAGSQNSFFVKTDGTLWAMGDNSGGALGDGTTTQHLSPVQIGSNVVYISPRPGAHTLFITSDGTLWGFGNNSRGELGDGTTTIRLTPIQIATHVSTCAAGGDFSLYVTGNLPPAVLQETVVMASPTIPTVTPNLSALPPPEHLSSQFTSFYSTNRQNFDQSTQSLFDAEVIRIGQWLNSHKNNTVSNVFLIGADVVDTTSHALSIGLAFLDISHVFNNGSAALGSDAQQLATIGDYSLGTASEVGLLPDTADKVRSITSATLNVATNYDNPYTLLLGLNATIWGDWVVPQMRQYGKDPVDLNYKVLVSPQRVIFQTLPSSPDTTADLLLKTELQSAFDMGMYLQAANQTLDKYAGALTAGDSTYAVYQMKAFISYMDMYNQAAQKAGSDVKALGNYLSKTGFTAENENSTTFSAVQQEVKRSGFSPSVLNFLNSIGFSNAQIDQLKSSFLAYTPATAAPDISFLSQASAAAMTLTSAAASSQLTNLSVRTTAGIGDSTLIAGFAVAGPAQKSLLVRGVGPTLTAFGVTGSITSPRLDLYSGQRIIQTNAEWPASLTEKFSSLGAFALPTGSKDTALTTSLGVGSYTAQIVSIDGTAGIALLEIYDDTTVTSTSRLVNVSARSQVGSGANILIAGFTIGGNASKQLLIRGIGPALATFGVGGVLLDPKLQIYQGSTLIAENDDWGQAANVSAVQAQAKSVGAFALPIGSKDSTLLATFPPGSYTAQVSGVGNTTGVALVEIYDSP
jgi:alpha-tubulin suppressor-like RCC1 family protein